MSFQAFFQQSTIGLVVCIVIFGCVLGYAYMARIVSKFYKDMIDELTMRAKGQENKFKNRILSCIYTEYSSKVKSGIENVNTGAIVEKYIPVKISKLEWTLNYFLAVSTVLGLLGTFLGLTGSLGNLSNVLKNLSDMQKVMEEIQSPISHISTAFFASISGITGSIIMNIISLVPGYSYRNSKYTFYSEIENVLDNEAYAYNMKNYNQLLVDFTDKVEGSMKYMADKVTRTFDEGIAKFAKKINGVSFDMTESAKILTNVIGKLETSVNNFNKPVMAFKESVDKFRLYYEGLDTKIKDIDRIAEQLSKNFDRTIEALNSNRVSLIEVGSKLRQSTENLANEHEKIMELVERIGQYSSRSDDQIRTRLEEANVVYKELQSVVNSLQGEVSGMSSKIAGSIKDILAQEIIKTTSNMGSSFTESIGLIRQQNEAFKGAIEMMGKTINAYGKLLSEMEVAVQEQK